MAEEKKPTQVADDMVVTIEYTLTVDGEILDSSEEEGPLEYLQGHGNVIPGLEKALAGVKVGESKKVIVAPADGYGEVEEDAFMDVPMSEFPEGVPLEVGIELEVTDKDGDIMLVRIAEVGEESVKLDTNHPLMGKTLHFEVKVLDVRLAEAVELEHGHVHMEGHEH